MDNDVLAICNGMDLRKQLLELIMLDVRYFDSSVVTSNKTPTTTLSQQQKDFFNQYPIGGVILYSENLNHIPSIRQLTAELQHNSPHGRFIAVDHEGGTVSRIKLATDTIGNMALGAINDLELTTQTANLIGSELMQLGINVNFSPCIDVNNNPHNPVIGVRSFGHNPQLVAQHGCSYIDGLHQQGIISCVKHFPGHGDVVGDSHFADVYNNKSLVNLNTIDLYPFKVAIAHGTDMVLLAHVVVPALDNSFVTSARNQCCVNIPATLSKYIVTTILRQQLRFNGVIVSDALDMHAISKNFTPTEATIMALNAGVDVILMPCYIWNDDDINDFTIYFNQIYDICKNDEHLRKRVGESCYRILKLKYTKLHSKRVTHINAEPHLNTPVTREFSINSARRAITLYKNAVLPWNNNIPATILILAHNKVLASVVAEFLLKRRDYTVKVLSITDPDIFAQIDVTHKVLLLTHNIVSSDVSYNRIVDKLNLINKPYIMFSCGNPYDILYVPQATTNILVFGVNGFEANDLQINQFTLNLITALHLVFDTNSNNTWLENNRNYELIDVDKPSDTD